MPHYYLAETGGAPEGGFPPKGVVARRSRPLLPLDWAVTEVPALEVSSSDVGAGRCSHAHLYRPVSMLEKQYFPSTFGDGDLRVFCLLTVTNSFI